MNSEWQSEQQQQQKIVEKAVKLQKYFFLDFFPSIFRGFKCFFNENAVFCDRQKPSGILWLNIKFHIRNLRHYHSWTEHDIK